MSVSFALGVRFVDIHEKKKERSNILILNAEALVGLSFLEY